jgi:hypothetical protein
MCDDARRAQPSRNVACHSHTLVLLSDWAATLAHLARISPFDHTASAHLVPPLDSVNVWPHLMHELGGETGLGSEIGSEIGLGSDIGCAIGGEIGRDIESATNAAGARSARGDTTPPRPPLARSLLVSSRACCL